MKFEIFEDILPLSNWYDAKKICDGLSNGWRLPTIEELKILQGFPKSFKLKGSYIEQWGLIGNSVPPPLTERIGKTIIKQIL